MHERKFIFHRRLYRQPHTKQAMNAMDHTIAGAASGETVQTCSAEGFTISGKRTEE